MLVHIKYFQIRRNDSKPQRYSLFQFGNYTKSTIFTTYFKAVWLVCEMGLFKAEAEVAPPHSQPSTYHQSVCLNNIDNQKRFFVAIDS